MKKYTYLYHMTLNGLLVIVSLPNIFGVGHSRATSTIEFVCKFNFSV